MKLNTNDLVTGSGTSWLSGNTSPVGSDDRSDSPDTTMIYVRATRADLQTEVEKIVQQ